MIVADYILSPLGDGTEVNVQAVREGRSALRVWHVEGVPEPVMASLFDPRMGFEDGLVKAIQGALAKAPQVDVTSTKVGIVISSTKGNIDAFEPIGESAQRIAKTVGNPNMAVVVSNACISGLHALLVAQRMLDAGLYESVIVAGMDVQSRFIVSGFQSFKALSPDECRPFDADRCGLNLGEAAACIILSREPSTESVWRLTKGAVHNDAVHISNPSRTGDGCFAAIEALGINPEELACISAHGTATLYNDEMEATALNRAGLSQVPTFSLKGYFGHTMGAAGLLETIVTLHAVQEGWIPATRGYEESGTRYELNVSGSVESPTEAARKKKVLKLLSGFGGCNAAVCYERIDNDCCHSELHKLEGISVGNPISLQCATSKELSEMYKREIGDYPKFYKMDPLCKLGFMAAERLLKSNPLLDPAHTAVVLFNRSGSLLDDLAYQETIEHEDDYYPSPAVFVYTLSNIVTGELSIRHGITGETNCFILPERNDCIMEELVSLTFEDRDIHTVIGGWCEAGKDGLDAELKIYSK